MVLSFYALCKALSDRCPQHLEAVNLPEPEYGDIGAFVSVFENFNKAAIAALGQPPPEVKQSELEYPTEDGTKVRAKLYQPTNPPKNGSPLIVMYHGGGFCLGNSELEEQTCRNFVQAFGATCISASYRLAPEFKFPTAPKDAWDCLKWAASNANSWGANPAVGFVVGGTSAGGNLAAVLAHVARDEKLSPPLTGQYLAVPMVLPQSKVPEKYKPYALSYDQNKDAPILPVASIERLARVYQPDENDGVWYATVNHPKGHEGLPPALLQIDGLDPLRDEGIIYERVLREELGIKTKLYLYPGLPHGHWAFLPSLKSSENFRREQIEGMSWLLQREADFSKVTVAAVPGLL
jgi:acetyl esterase/lipase